MNTKVQFEEQALIQLHKRAGAGLLALMLLLPTVARGGGVVANCTEADLRAALAGGGTVTFACDGTITLAKTITITNNAMLDATGHQVTLSGNNAVRVFYVSPNVTLTLISLSVANGHAPAVGVAPAEAGGILNLGILNAINCAFRENLAEGRNATFPDPGAPGRGGAILNGNGATFNASQCSFLQNRAAGGNGTNGLNGSPTSQTTGGSSGGAAQGGGIYNAGTMTLDSSLFANNGVAGGAGGRGGNGVHCYFCAGVVGQTGGFGGNGGEGNGAAIFNASTAMVVNCTFAEDGGGGGSGGSGGDGGDVWPFAHVEIAYNGGDGGSGGSASGAISDADGPSRALRMANCTVAASHVSGGAGGSGGRAGGTNSRDGFSGSTGAIRGGVNLNGAALINVVLANNTPGSNCSGTITDLGHNLSSDASGNFTNVGSLNNTDPQLGSLANNGGPTLTMALWPRSPAIDAGDTAAAPRTDQRGVARPFGFSADIGAYEFALRLEISRGQLDVLDLLARDASGPTCRLLTSTNLSDWQCVATNLTEPPGTVRFQDSCGAGETQRFYKVALP